MFLSPGALRAEVSRVARVSRCVIPQLFQGEPDFTGRTDRGARTPWDGSKLTAPEWGMPGTQGGFIGSRGDAARFLFRPGLPEYKDEDRPRTTLRGGNQP